MRPHRWQPTRLPRPWDSPGKNTGIGCHFLLQCMKVKSESEVAQSCPTLHDPMDCSLPGSSVHGSFQARVMERGAIAFSAATKWVADKCLWEVLVQEESLSETACAHRYRHTSALLLTSREEGWQGQTILSAAACGVSLLSRPEDWAKRVLLKRYFPEVKAIHYSQSLNGWACHCCSPFGCCCLHSFIEPTSS